MSSDKVQIIAMEFDGLRTVSVTYVDPQHDNPVATQISVLQISPEAFSDEIAEIVDDVRELVDKVLLAIRNPPAAIRRR